MRLHFPNSAFLGNIESFIRRFDPADPDVLEVSFNKKWISVHPVVLAMAAALGLDMKERHKPIHCEPLEAASKHYLERMDLDKYIDIPKTHVHTHESAGRFIAISVIRTSEELTTFIREMIPLLHTTPEQTEPINYVITELVRNVFEHAKSPVGAVVCAQYFKKSNRVSIGVADLGVGIRKTIQMSHAAKDDIAAIRLALTPGVTGTTNNIGGTEENAGAGLFFIKSIAKVNREFFIIYSGDAMYKLLKEQPGKATYLNANPEKDKSTSVTKLPHWQGTAVGIDIACDSTHEFDALLDLIRQVYRLDVSGRKRQRFKKPRFI